MRKHLLQLLLVMGFVASSHLPLNAAPPQNSGIIVSVADLPVFVSENNLRIVSSGHGKRVDMTLQIFNQTSFQIPLKAGTYTLEIIPVPAEGELSAPPSVPVVVEVERKAFTQLTLSYTPEPQ